MEENHTVDCPYCEDFSGPPRSVAAHAQGRGDPQHKGLTFGEVLSEVNGGATAKTSKDETRKQADSNDDGRDRHETHADSAPDRESPVNLGKETKWPSDGKKNVSLPCGHETFDKSKLPNTGSVRVQCDECQQSWQVSR